MSESQLNLFIPKLWVYFSVGLLANLFIYVVGKITYSFTFRNHFTEKPIADLFYTHLNGFIIIVTSAAIVWTKGNTILSLVVALLIINFLINNKLEKGKPLNIDKSTLKIDLKNFLIGELLFTIIFIMSFYLFFLRSGYEIWNDHVFYGNISNNLTNLGIESSDIYKQTQKPNFYHYGELWFNSFFSTIFHLNHLHALLLITFPYLFTLVLIGSASIADKYTTNKTLTILLGITLIIIKPIISNFFSVIDPIFVNPKMLLIPIFFIGSTYMYLNEKYFNAAFILLILIPIHSTILPGVLSSIVSISIIKHINKNGIKTLRSTLLNKYTLLSFFVFAYFVIFYLYVNKPDIVNNTNIQLDFSDSLVFILKKTSRVFIILLPVFLLMYYISKKTSIDIRKIIDILLFVLIGTFFSSVTGGIVNNFNYDAFQIPANFMDMSVPILIYCFAVVLLIRLRKYIQFSIVTFYIFLFVFTINKQFYGLPSAYPYSNIDNNELKFYSKIKNELDLNNGTNWGYLRNYNLIENQNNQSTRLYMNLPLIKLTHIMHNGYYAPICLSALEIPNNTIPKFNEKDKSQFYKFVQEHNGEKLLLENDLILRFIHQNNIHYIIAEPKARIPQYISDNFILWNTINQHRIYALK